MYPLLRAYSLIDRMHNAWYFTKIDVWTGYHQTRIVEEDIPTTAFHMCYDYSNFFTMPFSLPNGPTTFQLEMNGIFQDQLCHFLRIILWLNVTLVFGSCKHCETNISLPKHQFCDFLKRFETVNYRPNKLRLGPIIWDLILLSSNENLFVIICNRLRHLLIFLTVKVPTKPMNPWIDHLQE